MWVVAQHGALVNLAGAEAVVVKETSGGRWEALVYFSRSVTATRSLSVGTREECETYRRNLVRELGASYPPGREDV